MVIHEISRHDFDDRSRVERVDSVLNATRRTAEPFEIVAHHGILSNPGCERDFVKAATLRTLLDHIHSMESR